MTFQLNLVSLLEFFKCVKVSSLPLVLLCSECDREIEFCEFFEDIS